jgi:hypothetical protein
MSKFYQLKERGQNTQQKRRKINKPKSRGEIANKWEMIQKCDIRVHFRVYITMEGWWSTRSGSKWRQLHTWIDVKALHLMECKWYPFLSFEKSDNGGQSALETHNISNFVSVKALWSGLLFQKADNIFEYHYEFSTPSPLTYTTNIRHIWVSIVMNSQSEAP